jgi:hypothetical protein
LIKSTLKEQTRCDKRIVAKQVQQRFLPVKWLELGLDLYLILQRATPTDIADKHHQWQQQQAKDYGTQQTKQAKTEPALGWGHA